MRSNCGSAWSLIGLPDHEGVLRVGGRLGAASGPRAFRQEWKRFSGNPEIALRLKKNEDLPASQIHKDIAQTHENAKKLIFSAHLDHAYSVVVGGGHDLGFPHLQGVKFALEKAGNKPVRLGCINLDAHLDVRQADHPREITSGSPFYLALEQSVLNPADFVEFGIQEHCNRPELWAYVHAKKVKVIPFYDLRHGVVARFEKTLKKLAASCDAVVVSFDLDSVSSAYAPGVSAPQIEGFNPSEVLAMLEIAGRHPKVVSLGIFELNPEHDIGQNTARLAATGAYHFISQKFPSRI